MNTRFNLPETSSTTGRTASATTIQNAAEWLLTIESVARNLIRLGASTSAAAECLEINSCVCDLAIRFATARDGFKLRALVEDWNLSTISQELQAAEVATS